jgi:hypothetical protein
MLVEGVPRHEAHALCVRPQGRQGHARPRSPLVRDARRSGDRVPEFEATMTETSVFDTTAA